MLRLLSTLLLIGYINLSAAQDYTKYHLAIIKAEEQIFVKQQFDDGLKTYSVLFKEYDFVFVHDCVMAMQIALHTNNEKRLLEFTTKAMLNGLAPKHLESPFMKYFQQHALYIKHKDSIARIFKANRQHYLQRIDTGALITMMQLFCNDQLEKNPARGESIMTHNKRYRPQIMVTTDALRKLIAEKGYPSDKLIGIDQQDLLHELKTGRMDPFDYYKKYKDEPQHNIGEGQFDLDEYHLASSIVLPVIVHYAYMIKGNADRKRCLLYADDFYLQQIKLGNLHPKDFAFMYDWGMKGDGTQKLVPDFNKDEKFFDVGIKPGDAQRQVAISDADVNRFRRMFYIAPIENDRAKIAFIRANKMYIGWGWWAGRS